MKDVFPIEHAEKSIIAMLRYDMIAGPELFRTLECIRTAFPDCSCVVCLSTVRGQQGLGRRQASVHVPQVLDVGEKLDGFRSVSYLQISF